MRYPHLDIVEYLDASLILAHIIEPIPTKMDDGSKMRVYATRIHNWYHFDKKGWVTGKYGVYRLKKQVNRG